MQTALNQLPQSFQNLGPILELFAGRFGVNVDVLGSHSWPDLRYLFSVFSRTILRHQSVPLKSLSLEDRFEIATKLCSITPDRPDEFLQTVGLSVSPRLVSLLNSHQRSALHWAARNWLNQRIHMTTSLFSSQFEPLISALMKHGSPLHALDVKGRTPLMYMLDSECWDDNWTRPRVLPPDTSALLNTWASLLVDAGVSLSAYVEQENMLLRSLEADGGIKLQVSPRCLVLQRVLSCDQAPLLLEVIKEFEVEVWQYSPPPGAFSSSEHDQARIC